MFVDVGPFLRLPAGATRAYRLDEYQEPSEELSEAHVGGKVSFMRTSRGILVSASLSVTSRDVCSRCLEPLESRAEIDFQEEYAPTVDVHTGAHLPLFDDVFAIDERQTLDLDEVIRQYRLASQSMKPLCRPDCKGLCPDCGRNLNLGPCSCPMKAADPRWSRLAELGQIEAQISHERGS
jgi:uncharacterized protein